MNLPSSRVFLACPACNGRGRGPGRELVAAAPAPVWLWHHVAEWVPVDCADCQGRGWVRADAA